ncbi:hypothetical protein JW930_01390 [Candidatus Woesearchaeota archaeon]|nr:hypothetical protein [Candidatus Woesearchaeota archaeon]
MKLGKKKFQKYFNLRNILIFTILLVISFFLGDYVKAILCTALFVPLNIFTTRIGKFVPHVTPETVTITAIFMSYEFGWRIGVFFGLAVGGFSYIKNSLINLNYITVVLLSALCAVIVNILKGMVDFFPAFAITIALRNAIALPIYMFVIFPNPPENIMHQSFHTFLNILVYTPVMSALHQLLSNF